MTQQQVEDQPTSEVSPPEVAEKPSPTADDIKAYLDSEEGKSHRDRWVQSEAERARQAVRSGKQTKLHPKIEQLLREAGEVSEQGHRSQLQQAQQQQFNKWWAELPPDQKGRQAASLVDNILRDESQKSWMEQHIEPQARQRAVSIAGGIVHSAFREGIPDEEWSETIDALRESGIDDTTPEGAIEMSRVLLQGVKEYYMSKAEEDVTNKLDELVDKKLQAVLAERFGEGIRKSETPDQGKSAGGSLTGIEGMSDNDVMTAWAEDRISDADYYRWRGRKGLPTQKH